MKDLRSTTRETKSGMMIYLRSLRPGDVSQDYADWLNDPETVKYLESRYMRHTLDSCTAFVKQAYESDSEALFGIFQNDIHVGNIKIGNIHPMYRRGDVGLIIGKPYWRRGIGKLAIALTEEIAFSQLKLHKLYAGAYKENIGSIHAFLHNGWSIAGEMKEHYMVDGRFVDSVWMEKLNRQLILRIVLPTDIHILFELANDTTTRENSFNTNEITWQEHEQWFNSKLQDKDCRMYIAQDGGESVVGQIRVERKDCTGIISLNVSSEHRGQGHGTEMLCQIIKLYEQGTFSVCQMSGRVKISNIASQKAFLKANFIEVKLSDYYEYWYPFPPKGATYA